MNDRQRYKRRLCNPSAGQSTRHCTVRRPGRIVGRGPTTTSPILNIYFFYKISLHFTYCCLGFQQMWRDEKEAKKERKGGENKILGSFQLGDVSEEW